MTGTAADVLPMERYLRIAGARLALVRPAPMRTHGVAGGRAVEAPLSFSVRQGLTPAWQTINRALKRELQDLLNRLVREKVISRADALILRGEHGVGPRPGVPPPPAAWTGVEEESPLESAAEAAFAAGQELVAEAEASLDAADELDAGDEAPPPL